MNTNDSNETNLCSWEVRESMSLYDKQKSRYQRAWNLSRKQTLSVFHDRNDFHSAPRSEDFRGPYSQLKIKKESSITKEICMYYYYLLLQVVVVFSAVFSSKNFIQSLHSLSSRRFLSILQAGRSSKRPSKRVRKGWAKNGDNCGGDEQK